MSDAHLSQLTFDSLNIPGPVKRGIAELGYSRCTPIQAQTLPLALAGRDVAGQAQTGTGKTAAFLVALFNRLLTDPGSANRPQNAPRAIVIAPTRELAVQIHSDAEGFGKYTGLKLAIVFGGVDYDKQRRILEQGVDVLIGTPGASSTISSSMCSTSSISKWRSWMKRIACSIWDSSRTFASSCAVCRIPPIAST